MRRDQTERSAGLTYLESIRDVTQVERYLRADQRATTQ
jgi:hypothetical protein